MRVPITLDLHLPNFNYPDVGPAQAFDKLVEIALTAERSGFSSISLMDHLHQIPGVGPQENWMFDGNTMLSALAARTSTLTLGTLVGGVTYRNPALLAKITTTVDIVSGGRAWHGIGAAWFDDEHRAYGFEFPPLKERFERLEEALQITRAMFTQERATFAGKYFHVDAAYNNPKPVRGDIPILIGGSGERKTLRMVAQYADGCNLFGDKDTARHKLEVLEAHCEKLDRDPAEITKTAMAVVLIAPTHEAATAKLDAMRQAGVPALRLMSAMAGAPDTVAAKAAELREVGIEGLTISLPDVHDLETLQLAGQALGPVFARSTV
ncbi:MAG: LLM class F420-dependent oxidoreductase [Solirubrobacteraceae bacterium]